MPRKRLCKKGISLWVSWVLVMMLAVILGTVYFGWMRDYAVETVDDVQERSDYITVCESSGIWVKNICQNTQTLNMNITNSNDLKIDEVIVRTINVYGDPTTDIRNVTLIPGETKNIEVLKQEITKQMEIIPIIHKDSRRIICSSRTVTMTGIGFC